MDMKKNIILFFVLSLSSVCFSDPAFIEYVPNEKERWKKTVILSKNVTKIELVKLLTSKDDSNGYMIIDYASERLQQKFTFALNERMLKHIIIDFNEMALVYEKESLYGFCCEIRIYESGNIITTFKTNGYYLYDEKHNLLYKYRYADETNLIQKYWNIEEGINRYIRVK